MTSTTAAAPATPDNLDTLLADAGIPKRWGREAILEAELARDDAPTDEQRARAGQRQRPKGLKGKALGRFILTGERLGEQVNAARTKRAAAAPTTPAGQPGKVGERVAGSTPAERTENHRAGVRAAAQSDAATAPATPGLREGSALHAAVTVLADATEPMTPQAIYDAAVARGLAGGLKGKTPVATLAAQMATANKRGQHVERPAPGRYQLRAGAQA